MTLERITARTSEDDRRGHEARYSVAAGFLRTGDRVIDAACGTGYGAPILARRGRIEYVGVERDLSVLEVKPAKDRSFLEADLETWSGPTEPFDVAIVFETIEHLANPIALTSWTHCARRLVLVSTPLVPTVQENPYHLRDYRTWEIEWWWGPMRRLAYFEQPEERSGVWVFGP